jgi:2-polyprenyl-3-methyl-5-hydroxy-6-metoxy-1,4-benzoquinol methylase
MNDYLTDGNEQIYNIWQANPKTRLYKNEMLRNQHLFEIVTRCKASNHVIDIGCGAGYLDYLLAKVGKQVTAVDLSKKRLNLFKEKASLYGITQINENLFNLNVNNFNMVISQEVLEHIEDYESALIKMNSFVNKGGMGIFCVPYNENLEAKMIVDPNNGKRVNKNGHLHSFTISKLEKSIKDTGFEVIKSFLLVNKRSYKFFARFKIPVNKFTLQIDKIMNFLFPVKAAYLAVLCRKK